MPFFSHVTTMIGLVGCPYSMASIINIEAIDNFMHPREVLQQPPTFLLAVKLA